MFRCSALMCLPFVFSFALAQSGTYHNYAPVLSPDGKKIAYYGNINGNWDLYLIDADGQNQRRITTHSAYDGEPWWSPDSSKLVFTSNRDGDDEIYIIDIKNLRIEQITINKIPDDHPTFSPDGQSIVYRSQLGSQWFIFRIALEGKERRILSNISIDGRIRWSTQGSSLNFTTVQQNRYALCRMDKQGNPISLTFTKFDFPGNPHYSDSQGIFVFDAHKEGSDSSGDGKWELWTIDPSGDDLKQLTNNDLDDWGASWSANGKFLVYAGNGLKNTGYEIFIYDLEKQTRKQLTAKK